jgi:hypothetical protein
MWEINTPKTGCIGANEAIVANLAVPNQILIIKSYPEWFWLSLRN